MLVHETGCLREALQEKLIYFVYVVRKKKSQLLFWYHNGSLYAFLQKLYVG